MSRIAMELLPASLLIAGIMLWHTGAPAQDSNPIRVVTTTPDLAAFIQNLGGEDVVVVSLTERGSLPGETNWSQIEPLLDAEILIAHGQTAELAWLDRLVRNTPNRLIQPNGRGRLLLQGSLPREERADSPLLNLEKSTSPNLLGLDPTRSARVIAGKLGTARPELANQFLARVTP